MPTPRKRRQKPATAAEEAAYRAKRALWAAIVNGGDPNTACELAQVALDTAIIAATEPPQFYSMDDLAKRYGISRKTVSSWQIPRHKFGESVRFSREDIEQFELAKRE